MTRVFRHGGRPTSNAMQMQRCSKNQKQLATCATAGSYVKFVYTQYMINTVFYIIMYVVVKHAVTSRKCWPGIIIYGMSHQRRPSVGDSCVVVAPFNSTLLCHCRRRYDSRSYKHFYKRKMVTGTKSIRTENKIK